MRGPPHPSGDQSGLVASPEPQCDLPEQDGNDAASMAGRNVDAAGLTATTSIESTTSRICCKGHRRRRRMPFSNRLDVTVSPQKVGRVSATRRLWHDELMPERPRMPPIQGIKMPVGLRKHWSRLWESNPRPTHYEGNGQRRLCLLAFLPATTLTSWHSRVCWSCCGRPVCVTSRVTPGGSGTRLAGPMDAVVMLSNRP
jgi:hypothetical protein